MEIVVVLTSRCNAQCTHCTTSCGPRARQALNDTEIERVMSQAANIDDDEPLVFNLTGGEPFLDFLRLLSCVARGARLGGKVSVVSNAFWASSEDQARAKLSELQAAGLSSLAISVSRFHAPHVPLARVRIALQVADELGLETELKAAVINSDLRPGGLLEQWQKELDADFINVFPVLPYLRDGASLPEDEYYRLAGLPEQACPAEILCVESDGTARSCCGSGVSTPFLALGSVHETDVAELRHRLESAPRQKILREQGPIAFARAAISAGHANELRASYAGPCDLCAHIASNPRLRRIAEEMSASAS